MHALLQSAAPPLRLEESGVIYVGDSRVPLEQVIEAFDEGASAETILDLYSTTTLADIYTIIGFYLNHRREVQEYVATRRGQAAAARERIMAAQGDLKEFRERILARQALRQP